ncbi:PpiC-type peptidyl-prolyl cis-trans isomerase [Desulforamulus reducens MI-1]|uniref:peptidylprolyl isomerase n=1 Tax=Desulforamulus reducens (strain ATCC BAA-1160 / DSM 100696 / MI-1) TaxID=349161 RepID=A4J0Q9_DESRM|nr:peptidylprolyl isomerase [Desulforamulus reducens]ABO48662.1 PpiC-type peptidyl-prolyl cis-trans isomerase [Desulforamulus reducens MI-1]
MKNKFLQGCIPIFLSLLLLLTGCANNKANVVATVNGKDITRQQLDKQTNQMVERYKQQGFDLTTKENKAMKEQLEQSILDDMITKELLLQEAEKQKLIPAKEAIDKNMAEIKKGFPNEEEYKKALEESKVTEAELREQLILDESSRKLYEKVTADVKKPTDEEITKFYNENKGREPIGTPERLEVKHMLFAINSDQPGVPKRGEKEALEAAKLALAEVTQKGRDFGVVAREKSDDLGTRENGGSYTIDRGANTTDPAFEKAAENLKPGEITKEPVKSAYGFHIIKLEKVTPASTKALTEVKDSIAAQLEGEAKQAKFTQFIDNLRKNAKINNKLAPKTEDSSKK